MTIASITLYIFGTTAGLEVKRIKGYPDIDAPFDDKWLDLRLGIGQLVSNSPVYLIERRVIAEQLSTWIGGYWPAREIGTSRPGGQAGAGLLLCGCSVDSELAIRLINDLYTDMATQAISGGEFTKRISNLGLSKPIDLENLLISKKELAVIASPKNSPITLSFSSSSELIETLRWAQSDGCAKFFSSIVLGYPANFASSTVLATSSEHYKSFALLLESNYKKQDYLLRAEKEKLREDYANLQEVKKQIEIKYEFVTKNNVELKSQNQELENYLATNKPNTKPKDNFQINFIYIISFIGIFGVIAICFFAERSANLDNISFWRSSPQTMKNDVPEPLKLTDLGKDPSDFSRVSGEAINKPSLPPSSSCYNDEEPVKVRYDGIKSLGDNRSKDNISNQLKEDCPEFTKPECASKLKEITDSITDKSSYIKLPSICLIKVIKSGRLYISSSPKKTNKKNDP